MSEIAMINQSEFNLTKVSWDDIAVPETFDEAVALLNAQGVLIETAEQVNPDAFPEVAKEKLVNVPIMLLTWNISDPDRLEFENQYIVVRGITKAGKRFRFSDGSTGIFKQLKQITQKRIAQGNPTPNAGLVIENGLVKSDYTFMGENGKPQAATTFYLANE